MRSLILSLCLLSLLTHQARSEDLLTPERWHRHVIEDLLPFWTHPDAFDGGGGIYPGIRCDDGSLFSEADPCDEIAQRPWIAHRQASVVAISRQAYAYGVAFHMTGDPSYLAAMRIGMKALLGAAIDPKTGLHFARFDHETGQWNSGANAPNLQEQSYALLGPVFYYYLTRDPQALEAILRTHEAMKQAFHNPETGGYLLHRKGSDQPQDEGYLISYLDQINAYLLLMAPLLQGQSGEVWEADLARIADRTKNRFYAVEQNVFQKRLDPTGQSATAPPPVDFGYTMKSFWFLQMTAALLGDQDLANNLGEKGKAALTRSFQAGSGAWANKIDPNGEVAPERLSWIFAEQSQFASSLAITDPGVKPLLEQSQRFWLTHFVDHLHGGIHDRTRFDGGKLADDLPKHWAWKAGFHSFEQALTAFITTAGMNGKQIDLFFAFEEQPRHLQPYFFKAEIDEVSAPTPSAEGPVTKVVFSNIRYAVE